MTDHTVHNDQDDHDYNDIIMTMTTMMTLVTMMTMATMMIMAKNHFSGVQNGSQSVYMGVLGGVFVLKSGLRILIRVPEVPFSVPQKNFKRNPP